MEQQNFQIEQNMYDYGEQQGAGQQKQECHEQPGDGSLNDAFGALDVVIESEDETRDDDRCCDREVVWSIEHILIQESTENHFFTDAHADGYCRKTDLFRFGAGIDEHLIFKGVPKPGKEGFVLHQQYGQKRCGDEINSQYRKDDDGRASGVLQLFCEEYGFRRKKKQNRYGDSPHPCDDFGIQL